MATTEERLIVVEGQVLGFHETNKKILVLLDAMDKRMDSMDKRMDSMERTIESNYRDLKNDLGKLITWADGRPNSANF